MKNVYCLPLRKARQCRRFGIMFLLVAALWGLIAAAQAIAPGWSFSCNDEHGCQQAASLTNLFPEHDRSLLLNHPGAQDRLRGYLARPLVHAGWAALTLLDEGLLVFLFVSAGLTLRRLGGAGEHVLDQALPWLKRGALAGLIWAVAQPITDSLRMMLLSPGTPSGASWVISIDLTVAAPALLLATAAYATSWALEAGVRAERDLAAFV